MKAMKTFFLALMLLGIGNFAFGARVYQPNAQASFTGGANYCIGAAAGNLTFTYNSCNTGATPPNNGTACSITWYYNPTNTTAITGATTVAAGPTAFTSATGAGNQTFAPSTATASTRYYFCVITYNVAGCAGGIGGTLTSTTQLVTVTSPNVYTVSAAGTGDYCTGGTGVDVSMNGSDLNVVYTLFNGAANLGNSTGTGGVLDFGVLPAGNYTVVAGFGTTCATNMSGTAVVTAVPLPVAYTVAGGGTYCSGGAGKDITLSSSQTNVNYSLYNGATLITTVPGSVGTSIDFGNQVAAGTYTVLATNASTLCQAGMNGSATIGINPPPTAYTVTVTNGGAYCAGGTGVTIGLANSQSGVSYQLYYGPSPVGAAVNGNTGNAISFGLQTGTGTYSVIGTNTGTTCTGNMSNTVTVFTNPVPTAYTLSGGGAYCQGTTANHVDLDFSDLNVSYQLFRGAVLVSTMAGADASLDFGVQGTAGTYSVLATASGTGCQNGMSNTITVTVNPLPTAYTLSASNGGQYCAGGSGVTLSINNSDVGTNYQLFSPAGAASAIMAGPGGTLSFGLQTTAGSYTVVATNPGTGCTANMNGNPTVIINPLPNIRNVTGGGTVCAGSTTNIGLNGSTNTVTYHLYNGSTLEVNEIGTGAAFNFAPAQSAAGTYTVNATDNVTGCFSNMIGYAQITVNPLPTVYTVTGGGGYCAGGPGVHIGMATTDAGFTYTLRNGASTVATIAGNGLAIDFGVFTTAGTYTVLSTNNLTSCNTGMANSVPVIVNLLPNIFTVSGTGSYCSGGTGVDVDLSNSNNGINYQLFLGSSPVGGLVAGSNGPLIFGPETAAGTYSVEAIDATTGCTQNMNGSATITINPLPTAYAMNGGGHYCLGGTGVLIGMANSDANVDYQLYLGAVTESGQVAGVAGNPISFGLQTAAGTYTVLATTVPFGCTSVMTGSEMVTIDPLPTQYAVTGGGPYCFGGTGVHVGLANSTTGVSYQLYNGSTALGAAVAGTTGSSIDFGLETAGGTYSVLATNTATTCTNGMTGGATVTVNPLPVAYTVTGGGSYCIGGTGVHIGLNNSQTGVSYQLFYGATVVATQPGVTGNPVDFGLFTATAAPYSVVATNTSTFCTNNMLNIVAVTTLPLPAVFNVTGGGSYCSGGTGVHIGLDGSVSGINYQLYNGATAVGAAVGGTGSAIDFGLQTTVGTYTVLATNSVSGCISEMNGSVPVSILPLPTVYNVVGGGTLCVGSAGYHIGLVIGSDIGVNYQLYNGSAAVGSPVPGTGGSIDFGVFTTAGTYSVNAVNATTGCTNNMTGNAVIIVNPLPAVFNVSGGGGYCPGGTGVVVGLTGSEVGVNYQLYNGSVATGAQVAGTGSAISFGPQTGAGTYTVTAINATTLCTNNMSGNTVVVINPNPTVYNVTGGGNYCSGGTGIDIGLSGSDLGVNYQPFVGSVLTGTVVPGTGIAGPFNIGLETTAGTYSVMATNPLTGCVSNMSGGVAVGINPLPIVNNVTGGGSYCAGGAGVDVGLNNSTTGISYQLYNGSAAIGTPTVSVGGVLDFGLQTAAGTYTVEATDPGTGCMNAMNGSAITVINPLPDAITGAPTVCTGSTVTYADDSSGGVWSSNLPAIASVGSVSGIVTGVAAGSTTLTYTLPTTCFVTAGITVNQTPDPITGINSVCVGMVSTLSNDITGGTWSNSNTSIATVDPVTGDVYGISAGNNLVSYTVSTGCFVTIFEQVNPLPILPAIGATTTSVCQNAVITYTNGVTGGVWSSGNTTIATIDPASGNITGNATGSTTITYTFTNGFGCSSSVTLAVSVNPLPAVGPISGAANVCAGATITLSDATSGGTWGSATPAFASVNSAGVVTGIAAGSATISYMVTNVFGCSSTTAYSITVGNAMPASAILPVGSATLCGGPVSMSVVSSGGTPSSYQWYYNGAVITGADTASYMADSAGLYSVIIGNGTCELTLAGTNIIAPPAPVIAYDSSANDLYTGSFTSYQWFLDGSAISGATGSVITPLGSGLYQVVVADANGCHDTASFVYGSTTGITTQNSAKAIRIYPNPATSVLYVDAPGKVFVSILSPDGKVLIEHKEAISINVGGLANGVYMIMIYDENSTLVKTDRFVKMQ